MCSFSTGAFHNKYLNSRVNPHRRMFLLKKQAPNVFAYLYTKTTNMVGYSAQELSILPHKGDQDSSMIDSTFCLFVVSCIFC